MSAHRREVKPRYGRIAALAGVGVLATSTAQAGPSAEPASFHHAKPASLRSSTQGAVAPVSGTTAIADTAIATALPAHSGHGRRIVFSQSRQRVWLVGDPRTSDAKGTVDRTYLVSGSVSDNLQPGTYSVYSKSRWAVGVDDSGVMQYFVRFTQGPTGAAIGFHSIPTSHDKPLQSRAQLGTPQSHGCIRQDLPDAIALWDFAPVGTKVVVTA